MALAALEEEQQRRKEHRKDRCDRREAPEPHRLSPPPGREVKDASRRVQTRSGGDECVRRWPRPRERAEFGHREVKGFEIERDLAEVRVPGCGLVDG